MFCGIGRGSSVYADSEDKSRFPDHVIYPYSSPSVRRPSGIPTMTGTPRSENGVTPFDYVKRKDGVVVWYPRGMQIDEAELDAFVEENRGQNNSLQTSHMEITDSNREFYKRTLDAETHMIYFPPKQAPPQQLPPVPPLELPPVPPQFPPAPLPQLPAPPPPEPCACNICSGHSQCVSEVHYYYTPQPTAEYVTDVQYYAVRDSPEPQDYIEAVPCCHEEYVPITPYHPVLDFHRDNVVEKVHEVSYTYTPRGTEAVQAEPSFCSQHSHVCVPPYVQNGHSYTQIPPVKQDLQPQERIPPANQYRCQYSPVPSINQYGGQHAPVASVNQCGGQHAPTASVHQDESQHMPLAYVNQYGSQHVPTAYVNQYGRQHAPVASVNQYGSQHAPIASVNQYGSQHAPVAYVNQYGSQHAPIASVNQYGSQHAPIASVNQYGSQHAPIASVNQYESRLCSLHRKEFEISHPREQMYSPR